jgi:hypothetical protein
VSESDVATARTTPRLGRRWLGAAALVLVAAAATATASALRSPEVVAALALSRGQGATPPTGQHPIDLLSLEHVAEPDGAFVVSGIVQNPWTGRELQAIEAVVYLFDADGQYFATGRSALVDDALAPGRESPFAVRVENGAGVSRYRVGFRRPDGRAVAHVDRRSATTNRLETPAASRQPVRPSTSPDRQLGS